MSFEKQVDRNLKGIKLEKAGKIDEAIKLYEMNINESFDGNHPYDRLAIIYRKRKQFDDEIRVLEKAVRVWKKMGYSEKVDPEYGPNKLKKFIERLRKAQKLQRKHNVSNYE